MVELLFLTQDEMTSLNKLYESVEEDTLKQKGLTDQDIQQTHSALDKVRYGLKQLTMTGKA